MSECSLRLLLLLLLPMLLLLLLPHHAAARIPTLCLPHGTGTLHTTKQAA
jgi:hypothetical protein